MQMLFPVATKTSLIKYLCGVQKKSTRLALLKYAIICCIVFCACSNEASAFDRSLFKKTGETHISFSTPDAPDFYCPTIQAGTSCSTIIRVSSKNLFPVFPDLTQPKQPNKRLKFPLYIFYSGNFLAQLRKKDIIYPFHYFW